MNIFFLVNIETKNDDWAIECCKQHVDKHVVKMIIEYAQLLSSAHRILDGTEFIDDTGKRKIKRWKLHTSLENILYKATHPKHPSAIWVRETTTNYNILYKLFINLCDEYTYRYGKIHLTDKKLRNVLNILPKNIIHGDMTKLPQAMPNQYKCDWSIQAYHNYYIGDKQHIAKWTKRHPPEWFTFKDKN